MLIWKIRHAGWFILEVYSVNLEASEDYFIPYIIVEAFAQFMYRTLISRPRSTLRDGIRYDLGFPFCDMRYPNSDVKCAVFSSLNLILKDLGKMHRSL